MEEKVGGGGVRLTYVSVFLREDHSWKKLKGISTHPRGPKSKSTAGLSNGELCVVSNEMCFDPSYVNKFFSFTSLLKLLNRFMLVTMSVLFDL